MAIQIPQGFGQVDAAPGLNTAAAAFQENTKNLGPSLIGHLSQEKIAQGYQDIGKAQLASIDAQRKAMFQATITQRATDIFAKSGGEQRAAQIAQVKNAGITANDNPTMVRMKLLKYNTYTPDAMKQQHIQQEVMGMLQEAGQQALQLTGQAQDYQGGMTPTMPSAPQSAGTGMDTASMSMLGLPGVGQMLSGPMGFMNNPANVLKKLQP